MKTLKVNPLLTFFSAIIMLVGLANLSTNQVHAEESDTLRVGMEANYPPYNWTQQDDSNGAVKIDGESLYANGYDVQMAKKIAAGLGKKNVVVAKTQWDGLLPSLTSGKIDMIIAGMSPTPERRQAIDFTNAYYTSNIVMVVNSTGKYANATSLADFNGAKITGQLGTFHYDAINQIKGAIKEPAMKDFSAMRVSLESKTIDGYVSEKPEGISVSSANPNLKMIEFKRGQGFHLDPSETQSAIGLRKGDSNLEKVNEILATIPEDERDKMMTTAVHSQPKPATEGNWFINIWQQYGAMLLRGTAMTVFISLIGTIVGFFIGLLVGIIRTIPLAKSRGKRWTTRVASFLASVYIELFRGTPMIVQAAVFYYGAAQMFGLNLDRTLAALIVVSINTGAYLSEIIRSGIISTDEGQFEAASALGMNHFQRMRKIILPQAVRNSLPSVANEFIVNIKDTSVLSIISVSELFFTGSTIAGQNFQFFHTYLTITFIYLVLTFTITRIFRLIEKKLNGPKDYNLMANQEQVTSNSREVKN